MLGILEGVLEGGVEDVVEGGGMVAEEADCLGHLGDKLGA